MSEVPLYSYRGGLFRSTRSSRQGSARMLSVCCRGSWSLREENTKAPQPNHASQVLVRMAEGGGGGGWQITGRVIGAGGARL